MDDLTVHDSCGNIFRDMEMPDAEERLANALRVREIHRRIQSHQLSTADAAALAGCSEAELLEALRGGFSPATSERLLHVARTLGIE